MTREETIATIEEAAGMPVEDSTQLEALGLDSLETLDLLLALNIPDAALVDIRTVAELVQQAA